MDFSLFYSDIAIIIYEGIFIILMIILIRNLSKEKKEYDEESRKLQKKQKDHALKKKLVNQHRR